MRWLVRDGLRVVALICVPACDESRTPKHAAASPAATRPAALSPIETLQRIRALRFANDWPHLAEFLPQDQRPIVIAQICAVDRLSEAADRLRSAVRSRFGLAASQEFEFDQVSNLLGVLSLDVTLLTEEIEGQTVRVYFQIADRIPLATASMIRRDDRWMLISDPIAGVPEHIDQLAALMVDLASEANRPDVTFDALRQKLLLRQTPILERLRGLVGSS